MKKMQIFEPAMCCPTGICGVGVDPELLRISTVLETLNKNDIPVERFNLSNAPQEFVTNQIVNQFIKENGVEALPAVVVDGELVITGRYPRNDEFVSILELPEDLLNVYNTEQKSDGCCCSEGCCC